MPCIFEIKSMVQVKSNTAQKAIICRETLLGVNNSFALCYFDGPLQSHTTKQQAFFGSENCALFELDTTPAIAGTVSVSGTSTTVTGTGTTFTDFTVGDKIIVDMQQRTISSIQSDTEITVTSAFNKSVAGAKIYNIGQLY
jgi:hypothetical protein